MSNSLKSILLTGFLIAANTLVSWASPQPGPGGHWYELVPNPGILWPVANADANASMFAGMQGHLVTITSQVEDQFVLDMIYGWQNINLVSTTQPSEFWAGGYQFPYDEPDANAGWTWVNGEGPFPGDNLGPVYADWAMNVGSGTSEPNDAFGPGTEQFLGLGLKDFIAPSTWNDAGINALTAGYVVEYEAVPEGGLSLALLALAMVGIEAMRRVLLIKGERLIFAVRQR